MKRGPDLDIEAIFDDLESDRPAGPVDDDVELNPDDVRRDRLDEGVDEDAFSEDEEWERG
jgi:hypothetical protein